MGWSPTRCRILVSGRSRDRVSWSVSTKGAVTALDPRAPLVLDMRDLGRRAGSQMETDRVVPAPADLGVALARVLEGADMNLQVRCESAGEGIWVTGTVAFDVVGECARCLEPMSWPQEASFSELFTYPPTDARGGRIPVEDDDEDLHSLVEDDLIDLEPIVRDAVVLALPMAPLCREDCAGLCATCGVRLEAGQDHRHDTIDPRWAALQALTTDEENEKGN